MAEHRELVELPLLPFDRASPQFGQRAHEDELLTALRFVSRLDLGYGAFASRLQGLRLAA